MDPSKLQQQMMQMLQQAQKLQEDLENEVVEGSAGGVVTVKVTGGLRVTEVKIAPDAIDPNDAETLEDTILAAVNNGLDNARHLQQEKLGGAMGGLGGLGLPGF